MDNIKTETDIREWAKTIVEAKGEKYTPLSKNDLYTIARFIVERVDVDSSKPDKSEIISPINSPEEKPTPSKPILIQPGSITTRSYALHRAGLSVQQAYDKFLEWSKEHPKEGMVMDFTTGTRSANAAFAYWLSEIITVDAVAEDIARDK